MNTDETLSAGPPLPEDLGVGASPSADEILRSIRRILQGITIHSKKLYRETGMTLPQLLCLRGIAGADRPEFTAAEVSRKVRLSPGTVTGIIDRLEHKGLVRRERRSQDRRKICLTLTAGGQEKLDSLHTSVQERFVQRLMDLSDEERIVIQRSLRRVVEMLDAEQIDASPILVSGDVDKTIPPT